MLVGRSLCLLSERVEAVPFRLAQTSRRWHLARTAHAACVAAAAVLVVVEEVVIVGRMLLIAVS